MTWTRSETRWILDVEQQQTLQETLWQSPYSAPTPPPLPLPLFLLVCDQVVVMLSSCHVSLFLYLYSGFSTFLSLVLFPSPSSHALHMHSCVFTEQLLCHHATWDPVRATGWNLRRLLCCQLVYMDLGAKSLYGFTLDAKAFCCACHTQFTHIYKVKHKSPTGHLHELFNCVCLVFANDSLMTWYDKI